MKLLSLQQEEEFKNAKICFICENEFLENDVKCKDHCHLTGEYRGPSHVGCNINYTDSCYIPIVFHNLSGYDAHFIVKEINNIIEGKIDLLPINKEKYISFTKHINCSMIKFRFIDSFRFLSSSLDSLSKTLTDFPILKSQFNNLTASQYNLLTRKGVYPYDFFDSVDKFLYNNLPEKQHFYNELNKNDITDSEYDHAKNVWNSLCLKSMGEYSDLYLKTDVLLLADIFEKFRYNCVKTYSLDPAHYFTLPSFSWDAMLKYTKVKFELLTDIDMFLFIENK
jgi:hypothetical protein